MGMGVGNILNVLTGNVYGFIYSDLVGKITFLSYIMLSCFGVWYLHHMSDFKEMTLIEKMKPVFLGLSAISLVYAFGNIVQYYFSPTAFMWDRIGDVWVDLRIKGISMAKLLWSLFFAGLFSMLERLVTYLERR